MKTLKFTSELVPSILSGEKTATWRLFDDKDLQVGDHLECVDTTSGKLFATAQIMGIQEKTLGEITNNDFVGHEQFESMDKMLEWYQEHYDETVTWDTPIKMIDFEILDKVE